MIGQKILFNMLIKQVMKYIEKTADKKIASQHEKKIKALEKEVALLKKDSHPPQEYICCKKCGCRIAKTKSK